MEYIKNSGRLKTAGLFLVVCIFYSAWMTGLTFKFSECELCPNYNLLAQAFANGRLNLENSPATDTSVKEGKRYLYFGPVPALLRLPVMLIFKRGIPTGMMIVFFCAGISTFFVMIIGQLIPPDQHESSLSIKTILSLAFIGNGFSLLMVSIPVFYNEAISAAMFFLFATLYFFFRARQQEYDITFGNAVLIGSSMAMCIGSRFSYVFAEIVIGLLLVSSVFKKNKRFTRSKRLWSLAIIAGFGIVATGLIMWYNYARFEAPLEFGMRYSVSYYRDYMLAYGTYRYDHFPYNFWSYFFRIPQFVPEFPFLKLPAYFLNVQSAGPMPYVLVNGNELVVSIFCLMPMMIVAFIPLFSTGFRAEAHANGYFIVAVLWAVQLVAVALSLAAIARYYYDFVPLMMLMLFIGVNWLKTAGQVSNTTVVLLGGISVAISFTLPMNAIRFYDTFLAYRSPLLKIFF